MVEKSNRSAVIARLERLLDKIKLQSRDFLEVDFRVLPPAYEGRPFQIEVSKDRFSRRVEVDLNVTLHAQTEILDAVLVRELRNAALGVLRLAGTRK